MKKVYLLDTNIVSEFFKKSPNQNVLELFEERRDLCAISAVTWQEIMYGVSKLPNGNRKDKITAFAEGIRDNMEIIPYDDSAANICGQALSMFEKQGEPLPVCDTQIAATAIANGMVLVTHNTKDFAEIAERCFLKVEDWFTGSLH